jgi:alpha-galactosidase
LTCGVEPDRDVYLYTTQVVLEMKLRLLSIQLLLSILCPTLAMGVSGTPQEFSQANRWVAAKFDGKADSKPAEGYLMVHLKSGQVGKNRVSTKGYGIYATSSSPLKIADRVYQQGLYCPSEGEIVVHLPSPGRDFEATVGVDSNQVNGFYSNAGRGSVIATVEVAGKEAFRSGVMHEGMAGAAVKVDLNGATEFALRVSDQGGGRVQGVDFNQADWAEARVTLADGSALQLGDLPVGPMPSAYTTDPPFSFRYADRASTELLKIWELKRDVRALDDKRTEHILTYTDPKTKLVVRCVAVDYRDFPVVEWTVYFKNTSETSTPILENVQALDSRLERDADGEFLLHHSKGSPHSGLRAPSPTEYEPLETSLPPHMEKRLAAMEGLPAGGDLPYVNLESPGAGVILAVGWPGQWAARFSRDDGNGLQIQAGQELTHLRLLPGEEIRTPLIAMLFWKGEWIRSQNLWRRWMMAHNMPRPGGKLPPPQLAAGSSAQYIEMSEATEENQIAFIDRYAEEKIKFDYWWMDAGWHIFKGLWLNLGTWDPDPKRFPHGLRPISDHLHAKNEKLIVWFVPERVSPGTWLYENHPEWLLGRDGDRKLLNFGNREAWSWMTNHVDQLITEQGIDLYRNDGDPVLSFWRANDPPDRQGITEIHHVQGFLDYWDELRRRHPNMLTDICAGGGSRNEIETLRRAVPLWRSDYAYETTGMQDITYGMALWIPYFGTGTNAFDWYSFRSQMAPAVSAIWDLRRKDLDYDLLRSMIAEWRQVADNYYGDFYPLLRYRTENDVWMAWQFDRPESGEGMVQVFRRPESPVTTEDLKLRGLDPAARYRVTDMDVPGVREMTGRNLMEKGLHVVLEKQPGSAIISYKRVN